MYRTTKYERSWIEIVRDVQAGKLVIPACPSGSWYNDHASGLLESLILRGHVNPIITQGSTVLDGRWRLGCITSFYADQFPLCNFGYFPELNGLRYSQLSAPLRRRIEDSRFQFVELYSTMTPEMVERYIEQANYTRRG